jgi:hypothetical protein
MADDSREILNPYLSPPASTPEAHPPSLLAPIRLRGKLTLDHMVRTQIILQRLGRFRWAHLAGAALIVACLIASALVHERQNPRAWAMSIAFSLLVSVLGVISYWTAPIMSRLQLQEQLRRQFKKDVQISMIVQSDALHTAEPDAETEIAWSAFDRIRQSADLILLFRRDTQQSYMLPREFCENDGEWDRLRLFLSTRFHEA